MTWRERISFLMENVNDSWDNYVAHVGDIDAEFEYGDWPEGCPFTLWTNDRVYFPIVYLDLEGVTSVPRNPCDEAMAHVGCY